MANKFEIDPCRGITSPDKEHRVRKRGKVRNSSMKETKVKAKQALAMEKYDGGLDELC